ncbi:type II secretion system protein [Photobacterium damselae]|uniref:type II secretion system protein n=1 Tax=Photobacterium damselae TaxID=38293 RepID=UPI002543E623
MKKNQQGFTLTELVLTFVVVGVILATTVPLLLSKLSMQQQQNEIDQAISLTLERLQDQVSKRIEECSISHIVTVNELGLPTQTLHTLPRLHVSIGTNGKIISNVSLSFELASEAFAQQIQHGTTLTHVWITRHGKQLSITQPVSYLDSQLKRMNYDATTGCFK